MQATAASCTSPKAEGPKQDSAGAAHAGDAPELRFCGARANTTPMLRLPTGRSFSVSSFAGGITRKARPCSGYCSILYLAPHSTTATLNASE